MFRVQIVAIYARSLKIDAIFVGDCCNYIYIPFVVYLKSSPKDFGNLRYVGSWEFLRIPNFVQG